MSDVKSAHPVPRRLQRDGDALVIEWSDGARHRLAWSLLRAKCPCAVCAAKNSAPTPPAAMLPVLRREEARPIEPTSVRLVGNYAYGIDFNDGHNSGIYSLEYLYRLGAGK